MITRAFFVLTTALALSCGQAVETSSHTSQASGTRDVEDGQAAAWRQLTAFVDGNSELRCKPIPRIYPNSHATWRIRKVGHTFVADGEFNQGRTVEARILTATIRRNANGEVNSFSVSEAQGERYFRMEIIGLGDWGATEDAFPIPAGVPGLRTDQDTLFTAFHSICGVFDAPPTAR